jgi:pimeloyl-ACP methyl ester carboxylesterase
LIPFRLDDLAPPIAGLAWQGAGSRPLVAIHGWLDNAASFLQIAPWLDCRSLHAVDLPGHGHSGHLEAVGGYHVADHVAAVEQVMLALGGEPVDLVGHSLGALVASLHAATFPGRVRRLVLIEGLAPPVESHVGPAERLARHVAARLRPARPGRSYRDVESAVAARLAATPMSPDGARNIVERSLERAADGGLRWRSDRRLLLPAPVDFTEPQAVAFLGSIRCPTLVIKASDGLPVDADLEARLVGSLPQATTVVIPGGHHVHCDAPQACAEAINQFLSAADTR